MNWLQSITINIDWRNLHNYQTIDMLLPRGCSSWNRQAMADNAAPTAPSEQLNLKVKSQDGEEVFFKIKSTTQLKKLMDAYCQRQSVTLLLFSSMLPMFDSCLMASGCTKDKPPKISTWRMVTRSMLWLSKSAESDQNDLWHPLLSKHVAMRVQLGLNLKMGSN